MAKKAKRVKRTISEKDRRKYRKIRRQVDDERDEILAEARRRKRVQDSLVAGKKERDAST